MLAHATRPVDYFVNTAQGRWYFDGTTPEVHHLALVHDNADPTVGVISMGTSVPCVPVTTYPFVPIATGKWSMTGAATFQR
jgi:hypothetical protein